MLYSFEKSRACRWDYFGLLVIVVLFFSYPTFSQVSYPGGIRVNTTIMGHQDSPEIAVNETGTVVVVYESEVSPGVDETIFAVSYDRATFREFYHTGPATDTASLESFPGTDKFVIAWEQNGIVNFAIVSCSNGSEVFLREPAPALPQFQSLGSRPDVAISRDGSFFVIGWHNNNNVTMQFFSKSGEAVGDLINPADVLIYKQRQISLKFRPDSVLVSAWHSIQTGSFGFSSQDEDIWFQLFDCSPVWRGEPAEKMLEAQQRANGGAEVEGPVQYDQEYPEVDVFDDGRFVVMWQDFPYSGQPNGSDGSGKGAYFRIFNRNGTPQSGDIPISEHSTSFQKDADISIRQSDQTIHFIYEDAYEAPPDKDWLAYPSYRVFNDQGNALGPSLELGHKSYGTDCRLAITESDAEVPNLVLAVWETKDIENYDGSGRAVIFKEISPSTTVDRDRISESAPNNLHLYQNYPNPFNSATTIEYFLQESGQVYLGLYDAAGQEVMILEEGERPAGSNRVRLDAGNLANGVYFARLRSGRQTESIKLLNLK